jgi:hypothetical protein
MRLAELLAPQHATPRRGKASTVPEVFILESLELVDEAKERREGAVLAAVLKMCGKNPMYYYFRTKAELEMLAEEYEASGYRYLHLSCHGGDTSLETTIDSIPYATVAKVLASKLRDRRLFVSACSTGNALFSDLVQSKNEDVISIAAPTTDIPFDHAVAFWSAFYVKTFSVNPKSMSSKRIIDVFRPLVGLFHAPMQLSYRDHKQWVHEAVDASRRKSHHVRHEGVL